MIALLHVILHFQRHDSVVEWAWAYRKPLPTFGLAGGVGGGGGVSLHPDAVHMRRLAVPPHCVCQQDNVGLALDLNVRIFCTKLN